MECNHSGTSTTNHQWQPPHLVLHCLTHTHTHTGVLFGACQLVTLHTQPKAKQARTSVTSTTRAAPGLVNPLPGTTSRVTQNVRNHA